jgi:hypothetical protein
MKIVPDLTGGAIQTKGLKKLSSTLNRMWTFNDDKSMKKAATRSISKGITIVRRAYVNAAPNGPPKNPASKWSKNHLKMKKAVRRRVRRPRKRKNAEGKVGFNVGIKKNKKRAYHAHLVSVGTKVRFHKSGKYVGFVKRSNRISSLVTPSYVPAVKAIYVEYNKYIKTLMKFG